MSVKLRFSAPVFLLVCAALSMFTLGACTQAPGGTNIGTAGEVTTSGINPQQTGGGQGGPVIPGGTTPPSIEQNGSGASAPPISLPAPVTGRLTLTRPDSQLASLNIGDDQAVTPDSLVMAVNSIQEEASLEKDWMSGLRLAHLMDLLVPQAKADPVYPEICSQLHHACGYSNAAGAFEFPLQGEIDDHITLGIIDPTTGDWISPTVERKIPPNVRALPRPVLDTGFFFGGLMKHHYLYSLMPKTSADPKGLVEVHDIDANTFSYMSWPWAHPDRIDINHNHALAAVVDSVSNKAAVVNLALTVPNFNAPSVSIDVDAPSDAALSQDASRMIIGTRQDMGGVGRLAYIVDPTLSPPSLLQTIGDADLDVYFGVPGGSKAIKTVAIDHIYYNPLLIDLFAFVGTYRAGAGGAIKPYVGLLSPAGAAYQIIFMQELPANSDPTDVSFGIVGNQLLITDAFHNSVINITLNIMAGLPPLVALVAQSNIQDPLGLVHHPVHLSMDRSPLMKVYILCKDGDTDHPDSILSASMVPFTHVDSRNDVGLRPTGVTVGDGGKSIYISTQRSHAITSWKNTDF